MDDIRVLVKKDPGYTIAALMRLYSYQTREEQSAGGTIEENGMGFSGSDSGFLSSLAKKYQQCGSLTDPQVKAAARLLPKYHKQLAGLEPVEVKPTAKVTPIRPKPDSTGQEPMAVMFGNKKIKITFEFDYATIAKVKMLPGRRFRKKDKSWDCPRSLDAVNYLINWGFNVSQELIDWKKQVEFTVDDMELVALDIPGLGGTLRPFQEMGVAFIEAKKGRCLIGDEMGLGKTVQALGWLQYRPDIRPVIIVVPASLKLNWEREGQKWMPGTAFQVLSGKKPDQTTLTGEVLIINYDILTEWTDKLLAYGVKAMICDEVHYIKNPKTLRAQSVTKIGETVPHFLGLTGTLLENRPVELFPAVHLAEPGLFPSFMPFAKRYCNAEHTGFGWDFTGSSNIPELHEKLKSVMLRRLKSEVLPELPPKQRSVIPMEQANMKEYRKADREFRLWCNGTYKTKAGHMASNSSNPARALVEIEKVKQAAYKSKLPACISWIKDVIEEEKLVVFVWHTHAAEALKKEFKGRAVIVTGDTSKEARQAAVDAFQENPEITLFIGNIKAAGIGLTLTAASKTCFLEFPWTPGAADQAEDRVHRIGQEAESINAYYLVAAGSIEESILDMIDRKRKVVAGVMDGRVITKEENLMDLLREYKKAA